MKKQNFKRYFKPAAIAMLLASSVFTTSAFAALTPAQSELTPTMKGWAPYIPSVGTRIVGRAEGTTKNPQVGQVIEVPTYLIKSRYYTYLDGNASVLTRDVDGTPLTFAETDTQDGDADNSTRVREDQYLDQKVSVYWYIVEADTEKNPSITWADPDSEGKRPADYDANTNYVKSWDDIKATVISEEQYQFNFNDKSLALKIPLEAQGKRIGFIIVPESQTGDPFRGQPLKVPDLNYIWSQSPPEGPGEQCLVPTDPEELANFDMDNCLIDPTNPETPNPPPKVEVENPGNGGGVVGVSSTIITIRYQEGTEPNLETDPILGTAAHLFPLVNSTYYAEIKVITAEGQTKLAVDTPLTADDFRSLEPGEEVDSVTWNLFGKNTTYEDTIPANEGDAPAVTPIAQESMSYTGTDKRTGSATVADPISGENITVFTFRTQVNNPDAVSKWNINTLLTSDDPANQWPEFSEQTGKLQVTFGYDADKN